jgi:hypothetical protein
VNLNQETKAAKIEQTPAATLLPVINQRVSASFFFKIDASLTANSIPSSTRVSLLKNEFSEFDRILDLEIFVSVKREKKKTS